MRHLHYVFPMFLLTMIVGAMQYVGTHADTETLLLLEGRMDKIQHFLAGCACGIFGIWSLRLLSQSRKNEKLLHLVMSAGIFAFVIGFGWEILEHSFPEMNGGAHSFLVLDTILDLICDTLGGVTMVYLYRHSGK